ncbi:sensor histidine kinase, partial [Streptomyces scabiei]|nr:sensor histidine kinase [Streptomyces scabiei]
ADPGSPLTDASEDSESALAWALREAVTNVVRHSGARRCTVDLVRRQTLDGPILELTVDDDGTGAPAGPAGAPADTPGSGLAGLAERLEKVGGTLEAGRSRHGFRLVARAPATLPGPDVGSGA